MIRIKWLVLPVLFLTTDAFADESIHTYGGGQLLEQIFKALSTIFYGGSKSGLDQTFNLLIKLCLTVGAFCCICLAFFRQKFEPLIRSFLLPALAIIALILLPRTTIRIKDSRSEEIHTVENIPYFFGKFAVYNSTLFHKLKEHTAGALSNSYPWIEKIYSEKNPFRIDRFTVQNPELKEELRTFCRECVFHDLGLGLYTREELKESNDLFAFFKKRASERRKIPMNGEWVSCREAIERMELLLTSVAKAVSISPDELLFPEKHPEKEILQRTIASALRRELLNAPPEFPTGASQAVRVLFEMRNFLEALFYLAFPLAALLSLLSFGIKTLLQWVKLVLWVALWPVLYPVADLFLQSLWTYRLQKFSGTVTFGNANEIYDLYGSMELIACFALASLPIVCWILIHGGVSKIAHLTATFNTPPAAADENEVGKRTEEPQSTVVLREESHAKQTNLMPKQDLSFETSPDLVERDNHHQTRNH